MPSTSVQMTSSSASTTCAMIAPEKSELLRPSVVMRPSRAAPMKPVTTGTIPASRSGRRTSRLLRLDWAMSGLAMRNSSEVSRKSEETTGEAGTPSFARAAAKSRALIRIQVEFPQRLVVEVDEEFGFGSGETKGAVHERLRNGQQPVGDPTHRGNHHSEPRLPTRVAHQGRGMQDPIR